MKLMKKFVALLCIGLGFSGVQAQGGKQFNASVILLTSIEKQDGSQVAGMVKARRECQLLGKVVFAPPKQNGSAIAPGGWFVHFNEHACQNNKGLVMRAPIFGVIEFTAPIPRGKEIAVVGVR